MLVRPILDYAGSAWDPHTTSCIQQLEAVQRRAARFVTGDYRTTSSTSQMIQDLGWPSLQQRRQDAKLVMMYRIIYGLLDIPASRYLHHPAGTCTRGHALRYLVPYCRTDVYLHPFFPSEIRLWNNVPEDVAMSETLDGFDTRSGNLLSFLLPLFQEGQLSVTGESMCAKYWLTAWEV